jgi:DnaJ-class molecular chaperone
MAATEKCLTCKGAGVLTDWERDESDVAFQVTTDCDDCDGTGRTAEPTGEELAAQAAARAAYVAQRNADHFVKGYHDRLCGKKCRFGLVRPPQVDA